MKKSKQNRARNKNWDTGCIECFWRAVRSYELENGEAVQEILARYPFIRGLRPKLKAGTILYRGTNRTRRKSGISWTTNLGIAATFAGPIGQVYCLRNPVAICRTPSPQFPAEEEYLIDLSVQKHRPEQVKLSPTERATLEARTTAKLNPENSFVGVMIGNDNAFGRAVSVEYDLDTIRAASDLIVKEAFETTPEEDNSLRQSFERCQDLLGDWLGNFSSVPAHAQDCLLEGLSPADKRAMFLAMRDALHNIGKEIVEPEDRFPPGQKLQEFVEPPLSHTSARADEMPDGSDEEAVART